MDERTKGFTVWLLPALAAAALSCPLVGHAQAADAKAILKSMSDYVSSQKTIELSYDSSIEIITPQLEKLQFTSSGEMLMSRPDKLRAHRVGGYADVALYFDGKTVSVHGKNLGAYTQFDMPGTLDHLVAALREGHGVALPAADLLLSKPYETLMAEVIESKHIGRGVIDGVECEHLAFRNAETDWQLWVDVGQKPVPRKLVITSKTLNSAPQYTVRIKGWKTDVPIAAAAFAFVPPAGASKLGADALIQLDELPPGVPAGEKK